MTQDEMKESLHIALTPFIDLLTSIQNESSRANSALKDEIVVLMQRIASLEGTDVSPPENEGETPVAEEPPIVAEPPVVEAPKDVLCTPYNITSGEWVKGVSTLVTRFICSDTAQLRSAFVVGSKVRFEDGDVRDITKSTAQYNKIFVELSGSKLNPEIHGHGKTLTINPTTEYTPPQESEVAPAEPVPTPAEPTPVQPVSITLPEKPADIKGFMGTAIGMGMGYPQLVPGEMGQHYQLPTEDDVRRANSYGLKLQRLGSLRERLIKPGLKSELYLGNDANGKPYSLPKIRDWLRFCNSTGSKVMLDLFHNYGGFSEGNSAIKSNNPQHKKIGAADGPSYDVFANDWKAIIEYLKQDAEAWNAVYGVDTMNEWVGLPSDNVFLANQRFLDVCAPIMGDKLAVIEGNAYSNTPNFWDHNPRFKDLKDPRGPGFIEMSGHLYADQDMSGSYKTGDTVKTGQSFDTFYLNKVKPFLDGCDQYGFKANIGEVIVPGDHPKLLNGTRIGLEYALDRGCNVFIFGMGRGYSANSTNHWNLEIDRNIPTLEVVKALAARKNSA